MREVLSSREAQLSLVPRAFPGGWSRGHPLPSRAGNFRPQKEAALAGMVWTQ